MLKLICMSNEKGLHSGHRQRMYTRALEYTNSLSEIELLEILLYNCFKRTNTNELAHKLIRTFGSIKNVLKADKESLLAVEGIGKSSASYLIVLGKTLELLSKQEDTKKKRRMSFSDFKEIVIKDYQDKVEETAKLYLVDSKYRIIHVIDWTNYTSNKVDVKLKEIARIVLANQPYGAVLVHNHPSGYIEPSIKDDQTTETVYNLLKFHGVKLLDHIIVSNKEETYSYFQEGRLPIREGEKL